MVMEPKIVEAFKTIELETAVTIWMHLTSLGYAMEDLAAHIHMTQSAKPQVIIDPSVVKTPRDFRRSARARSRTVNRRR